MGQCPYPHRYATGWGSKQEARCARALRLEQITELLNRQPGVPGNTTHRERVDRVMARDGQNALAVAHDDVLSLTHDLESGFSERSYCIKVIYTRKLWQG